jgi:hypothetical protein
VERLEDRAVPAAVAPPAGIIGWWPGDGGPNDVSGSTYATPLNDTTYAAGQVGQAFSFDGSDDGVTVGGSANVQGPRTIEAWVFPHANSGYGLPIMTGGTVGHADFFGIAGTTGTNNGTAQYDLYVDHWNTPTYHSTGTLTPEAWNHVALTYDGASTLTFYINGKAAGSVTGKLYDYPINTYTIGGSLAGGTTTKASMNGLIDEPTLYNRALSATEIQAIYGAGAAGKSKPFAVVGNTPGTGQTVVAPPADFAIKLTQAYDPASVSAAALTVNGVPADSVTLTDAQTLTFHFATSPVTAAGGQTMRMAAGSLTAAGSGASLAGFTGVFLYNANTPTAGWVATNSGNPGNTGGVSDQTALTRPDSAGNVYVAGSFSGTITLGTSTLTSPGNGSASGTFLAQVNGNGNFVWAEVLGAGGAPGLARDGSDNLYLGTGSTLMKLDSAGNLQRTTQAANAIIGAVAADAAGNAYISGTFSGTAQFGPLTLTATSGTDDFLARVDAMTGQFTWAADVASSGGPVAALVVDGAGNVYAGGQGTAPGRPGAGYLLAADPTTGSVVWADGMSSAPVSLAVSPGAGTAAVALYAASQPYTVVQVDPTSGSMGWSRSVNGVGNEFPDPVAIDAAGNVYLVAAEGTAMNADPGGGTAYVSGSTASNTGTSYSVTKLDASGNFLAARQVGGYTASAVQVDGDGNIYTAGGDLRGTGIFDTGSGYVTLPEPQGNPGRLFVCKTTQATGNVFGQVFNDLNNDGVYDPSSSNPETCIPGRTVYVDLNTNGVLDPGEPSTVTGSVGQFEFDHLLPGSYTLRQVLPAGWTQTAPSGNARLAVSVAAGGSVDSLLFGATTPSTTRHYSNTSAIKTSKGKPNATSTLTVSDTYTVFNVSLTLSVSNTQNRPLTVKLTGPDGTAVTLVASRTINGTVTYSTPAFNYKGAKGTWTLEVDGLAGGTLNSWALDILGSLS